MNTYTINLPDNVALSSVHRFAPSSGNHVHHWSVSVRPTEDQPRSAYCWGTARHTDLQQAADMAAANLQAAIDNLDKIHTLAPKMSIDIDLDL